MKRLQYQVNIFLRQLDANDRVCNLVKTLIDRKLFQKKFLLHLISNPYVIYPFAAGAFGVFASWVFNLEPNILYLFGSAVVGIGLPIGALITKWTAGTDDIAKRVHEEILHEAHQKQEEELNALHQQLKKDGDKRTEQMLEELRALHQSFQEEARDAGWMATLPITVSAEITGKVSELFTQAVQCLKDTLKMHKKSKDSQLATVKRVLQQHREQQIADVQQTIIQLSHLYARVLTISPESNETELSRLRTELDESLVFAKKVDEQIREFTPKTDEMRQTSHAVEDTHTMTADPKATSTEKRELQ